ncbi:MAG: metal-sensitive transcriptional regulator [Chloroflexota bacterium]|nr:metal-sensitive transcriptional regulator [Chloroflexota bacterium]
MTIDNESDDLIVRLRRIEGQVKGIQKMMEERRPCREVLTQIMAARSSLDQVGVQVFQREVAECLKSDTPEGNEQIHQLQDTIRLWSKMA